MQSTDENIFELEENLRVIYFKSTREEQTVERRNNVLMKTERKFRLFITKIYRTEKRTQRQ